MKPSLRFQVKSSSIALKRGEGLTTSRPVVAVSAAKRHTERVRCSVGLSHNVRNWWRIGRCGGKSLAKCLAHNGYTSNCTAVLLKVVGLQIGLMHAPSRTGHYNRKK